MSVPKTADEIVRRALGSRPEIFRGLQLGQTPNEVVALEGEGERSRDALSYAHPLGDGASEEQLDFMLERGRVTRVSYALDLSVERATVERAFAILLQHFTAELGQPGRDPSFFGWVLPAKKPTKLTARCFKVNPRSKDLPERWGIRILLTDSPQLLANWKRAKPEIVPAKFGEAARAVAPAKSAAKPAAAPKKIGELMKKYERFVKALQRVRGLEVSAEELTASSSESLAELEQVAAVPGDLRAFWSKDTWNLQALDKAGNVVVKTRFTDAAGALGAWSEGLAGVPFQDEEEFLFAGKAGVGQMSNDPPPEGARLIPAAPDFTTWFEHFLAAGCYGYGNAKRDNFQAYWRAVQKIVPVRIAPKNNLWLEHITRWYAGEKLA